MTTVLLTIHIIVAILLIIVVLMQRGQAGGMGESFGGGSSASLFGSGGSGSFLVKSTGLLAAAFMITSLSLAFFSQKQVTSVVDQGITMDMAQDQGMPSAGESAADKLFDPSLLKEKKEDALPAAE